MSRSTSISDAKNRLPALVHDVEAKGPVELTRRGEPVAVLMSIDAYRRLQGGGNDVWDDLDAFRTQHGFDEPGPALDDLIGHRDNEPVRDFEW